MGGGLFGTPLYLNPKCLVFSAFVLGVYWAPHATHLAHRVVIAFGLVVYAVQTRRIQGEVQCSSRKVSENGERCGYSRTPCRCWRYPTALGFGKERLV